MATATKYGRTTTSTTVSEVLVQEDLDESCDDNGADAVDDSSEEPQTVGTTLVASTKMRLPLPTLLVSVTQKHHEAKDYTELVDWKSIDRCSDMECQTGVLCLSLVQCSRMWGLSMNTTHLWGGGIKFVENGYIGC